jgi:hypothetical protein
MDVNKHEKRALSQLYMTLCGYTWARNRGWIGRPKRLLGPEIRVLEAEAAQYDGLICGYHRKTKPGFNEDGTMKALGGSDDEFEEHEHEHEHGHEHGHEHEHEHQSQVSGATGTSLRVQYIKELSEPLAAKMLGIDFTGAVHASHSRSFRPPPPTPVDRSIFHSRDRAFVQGSVAWAPCPPRSATSQTA